MLKNKSDVMSLLKLQALMIIRVFVSNFFFFFLQISADIIVFVDILKH